MPHTEKDTEEKRETGLWTPESLIWIRALQRPPKPERSEFFFNYWMALLSRIAHSGPRSSWSGRKYVAVPIFQCSINGSPLGPVNYIQETTFHQTPPLSFSFDHEAGPGRTADSNALMCWPACSKHPHWTRSTNKLYVHTGRLVRTGISKFIYVFNRPSRVRSSKLSQTTPQHILKPNTALKLPLEVEDSVNTVLELILCFPADQQTCMAGINYLWSALLRPASGVSVKIFTDRQIRSVLRKMRLHGHRTPWDPRPSIFPVLYNAEMEEDRAWIYEYLNVVVPLVHSAGWMSIMDSRNKITYDGVHMQHVT